MVFEVVGEGDACALVMVDFASSRLLYRTSRFSIAFVDIRGLLNVGCAGDLASRSIPDPRHAAWWRDSSISTRTRKVSAMSGGRRLSIDGVRRFLARGGCVRASRCVSGPDSGLTLVRAPPRRLDVATTNAPYRCSRRSSVFTCRMGAAQYAEREG